MTEPGVGFEFPARKVSWLKRDVLLFNVSIGCKADEPQFVYVSLLSAPPSPPRLPVTELTRWKYRKSTKISRLSRLSLSASVCSALGNCFVS